MNTFTGFSGTLFMDKLTGEYTLSFRSVEFFEDSVRDAKATGRLEIKDAGWAFGQISDMEAFYAKLKGEGKLPANTPFNVTGYSLGGHLATAFAILRRDEGQADLLKAIYTFNGAGTGGLKDGKSLSDVLEIFNSVKDDFTASPFWAALDAQLQKFLVQQAEKRVKVISDEYERIELLPGLEGVSRPPLAQIAQARFEYQLAVLVAGRHTIASSNFPWPIGDIETVPTQREFVDPIVAFPALVELFGSDGGEAGTAFTQGRFSFISFSGLHHGIAQNSIPVYIEDQPLTRGEYSLVKHQGDMIKDPEHNNFADTHSLVLMVDSLSLMELMSELDPTLTQAQMESIFRATSNLKGVSVPGKAGKAEGDTLERVLDTLRDLFIGSQPPTGSSANLEGNTWHHPGLRNEFHGNLAGLRKSIPFGPGIQYSIVPLAGKTAKELKSAAEAGDGVAYRYALKNLNPFVVPGSFGVYAKSAYAQYDRDSAPDGLSKEYIEDRAEFLQFRNIANTNNASGVQSVLNAETKRFVDLPQSYTVSVSPAVAGVAPLGVTRWRVFGGDRADALRGGALVDRLYGGGGADWLEGKGANDHLEGGLGVDVYAYGAAKGILADQNDGADVIRDADGKGVLRYTFKGLLGGAQSTVIADATVKVSDTQWKSADGKFTYTKTPNSEGSTDLVITISGDAGGSMTIKGYRDRDLSIRLWEARSAPQTGSTLQGDRKPKDFDPATEGVQQEFDPILGNVVVTEEVEPDRADVLFGGRPLADGPATAGEKIDAGGGNDVVFSDRPKGEPDNGLGNADWIIGGDGRDWIEAGAGNDLVEAGTLTVAGVESGNIVNGGAGDDELYAETKPAEFSEVLIAAAQAASLAQKGDFLSGGAGEDWIVGTAARDALLGGGGEDRIVGGAGDDTIWGDLGYVTSALGWTVTRTVTLQPNGVAVYHAQLTDVIDHFSAGGADVIYAGGGEDWVFGDAGDDFIDGGGGDDVLFAEAGSDIVLGGAGHDALVGDNPGSQASVNAAGDDYLDGGEGNDVLQGDGGDDILIGGPGTDVLKGLAGRDIYVYNKGDGEDFVIEDIPPDANHPDASILVVGEGISRGDVKFRKGSLLVDFGPDDPADPQSPHGLIHFLGFDPLDPHGTPVLGEIRFADGDHMTFADILAQGFDIDGTSGDDDGHDNAHPILQGTAVTDRVRGHGGNDILVGLGGDDVLDGGAGTDLLIGGEGADTLAGGSGENILEGGEGDDRYVLTLAEGAGRSDLIDDVAGTNTIEFGAGIDIADLTVSAYDSDDGYSYLEIVYGADHVAKIRDGLLGAVGSFLFADGTTRDLGALLADAGPLNIPGNEQSNTIFGSALADRIEGHGGNDELHGGDGDDELIGGTGDDTLDGGAGHDRYQLAWGMGSDVALDAAGGMITLEAGLTTGDLFAEQRGADLFVGLRHTDSGLLIKDFETGSWQLEDENGKPVDLSALPAPGLSELTHEALYKRAFAQARAELFNKLRAQGYRVLGATSLRRDAVSAGPSYTNFDRFDASFTTLSRSDDGAEVFRESPFTFQELVSSTVTPRLAVGFNVPRGGRSFKLADTAGEGGKPGFVRTNGEAVGIQYNPGSQVVTPVMVNGALAGFWTHKTNGAGNNPPNDGGGGGGAPFTFLTLIEDRYRHFHTSYVLETIAGGDSDNTIYVYTDLEIASLVTAGAGNDVVHADGGAWYLKNADHSFLHRTVFGNFIDGGDGNDMLYGGIGADELVGGAGDDWLDGGGGGDVYRILAGEAGYDIIIDEGAGADFYGGRVDAYSEQSYFVDAYYRSIGIPDWATKPPAALPPLPETNNFGAWEHLYNKSLGDGSERVVIRPDTVSFLGGITPADLTLSAGRILLDSTYVTLNIAWGEDRGVTVVLPHGDDSVGAGIEYFSFSNGTRLTMRQMLALAPAGSDFNPFHGSSEGDKIQGNGAGNTLDLGAGDDTGQGLSGNDVLRGGEGHDFLLGEGISFSEAKYGYFDGTPPGTGNDILFGGPGDDFISGDAGRNALDGGAGDDLIVGNAFPYQGSGNFVSGGPGSDTLLVATQDGETHSVIALNRNDGEDTLFAGGVFAPSGSLVVSLGGGIAGGDLSLSRDGQDLVLDAGSGDALRFSEWYGFKFKLYDIKLQVFGDGVTIYDFDALAAKFDALKAQDPALDDWLLAGALDQYLVGSSPDKAYGGQLAFQYAVKGTYDGGLSAAQILQVLGNAGFGKATQSFNPVVGVNTAPLIAAPIADQTAQEDALFSFQLPQGVFSDAGDTLTLEASLAGGAPLPGWLVFDGSGVFHGTPGNADVGGIQVTVTATDTGGLSVADTFLLSVSNTNDAPMLLQPLSDKTAAAGAPFSYTVPGNAFFDVDPGDTLTLTASLADGSALPGWLGFDGVTRSFSGTPEDGDAGVVALRVTATDLQGSFVADTFKLTISEGAKGGGNAGTPGNGGGGTPGGGGGGGVPGEAPPAVQEDAADGAGQAATGGAPGAGLLEGTGGGIGTGTGMQMDVAGIPGALADAGAAIGGVPAPAGEGATPDPLGALLAPVFGAGANVAALELEPEGGGDPLTPEQIAAAWNVVEDFVQFLAAEGGAGGAGAAIEFQLEQALLGVTAFGGAAGPGGAPGIGAGAANLQLLAGLKEGLQPLQV